MALACRVVRFPHKLLDESLFRWSSSHRVKDLARKASSGSELCCCARLGTSGWRWNRRVQAVSLLPMPSERLRRKASDDQVYSAAISACQTGSAVSQGEAEKGDRSRDRSRDRSILNKVEAIILQKEEAL